MPNNIEGYIVSETFLEKLSIKPVFFWFFLTILVGGNKSWPLIKGIMRLLVELFPFNSLYWIVYVDLRHLDMIQHVLRPLQLVLKDAMQ
jgi:hypothetical protein